MRESTHTRCHPREGGDPAKLSIVSCAGIDHIAPDGALGLDSRLRGNDKLPITQQELKTRGFTLLEILVVLVIIGILSGVAAMSFVSVDQETLKAEATRLQSALRHAQDAAIFASEPRGVAVDQTGYRLLRFDTQRYQWRTLSSEKRHALPAHLTLSLELEGTQLPLAAPGDESKESTLPAIVFSPQGEMTPFSLSLTIENDSHPGMVIRAEGLSDIVLERAERVR